MTEYQKPTHFDGWELSEYSEQLRLDNKRTVMCVNKSGDVSIEIEDAEFTTTYETVPIRALKALVRRYEQMYGKLVI